MAVARTTSIVLLGIFGPRQNNLLSPFRLCPTVSNNSVVTFRFVARGICFSRIQCAGSYSGDDAKKVSARLSQVQQLLKEAEERAFCSDNGPVPRITIDHVTVSFARSGGPGGQNVNKVNTKVDMRFNVKNAYWLSDRIREKIMQMEKNRINKDGELVISSTKTRTQKGNIEDALEKLQAIIDAASYVPPPPSEEQKKKIEKISRRMKVSWNWKILPRKKVKVNYEDSPVALIPTCQKWERWLSSSILLI